MYKCYVCGRQFLDIPRLDAQEIWHLYSSGKQTYAELAAKFGCSAKTVQRKIDSIQIIKNDVFTPRVNVVMDTSYFGRNFGVMAFKDSLSGTMLLLDFVKHETLLLYEAGIKEISRRGIDIQSIICDGKKGIFALFPDIPMQMCQFHMIRIVNRYLTRKPKTDAAKELRNIALRLTESTRIEFTDLLETWHLKWADFLNEQTTGKKRKVYTHKRLRSAHLSLMRHLPYLFTFEDYPHLKIPNTTNALDGHFSDMKNKLRNHNGLSKQRKIKYINGFFKA
ncbi:MAG: transposase [Candidatus Symbiothrix sp.]|nr:transposase [Candidatus Symbiothrix sp.]